MTVNFDVRRSLARAVFNGCGRKRRGSGTVNMATNQGVEYVSLLSCKEQLISEISADPLAVSSRLVIEGLIPPSLLPAEPLSSKEKEQKARELVQVVTNKVKNFPSKFNVFVSILGEFTWLQDLTQLVREKYHEPKDVQVFTASIHRSG